MTVRVTTLKGGGAGEYYTREVEVGRYYMTDVDAGVWFGAEAETLGLAGAVEHEAFLRLMAGLDPGAGERLGRAYGEKSARGYDVTFNAPKSVSLLAELGGEHTRAEVLAAHDAAVDRVLSFIEGQAHTRTTMAGVAVVVDVQGLAVAKFRQHTSRVGEPHLHTHAVIVAKVRAPNGRWLALDARMVKHDQRTLSALYHAGLRSELTARLGVEWQEPVNGIAEVVGIDGHVLDRFSTRTTQLELRVQDKLDRFRVSFEREPTERERWRLEREAVLDSRRSKTVADTDALRAHWRHQLAELGLTPDALASSVIGRGIERAGIDRHRTAQIATDAQRELAENVSTWRRNDVIREIARRVPTTTTVDPGRLVEWIEQVADYVLERQVELAPPVAAGTPVRRDGRPVTESTLDRRYTTEPILREEEFLLAWTIERQAVPGVPHRLEADGLDRAQLAATNAVAGTSDLVVVVGPAGAGKTAALRTATTHMRRHGRRVFGLAPSATAARVLSESAGIDADTVDKLLHEHTTAPQVDPRFDLPARATVIVDEAGMLPTPKLADLARVADRRGWRVVLVGDPHQLGAVGRSGMFDQLVEHGDAIELDCVHRFTHEWERAASLELRRGNADALDAYETHDRISQGTRIDMLRATISDWRTARLDGERVVMLAAANDTVEVLNRSAQSLRIAAREIDPWRGVQTAGGTVYVGDEIVTRANDRTLRTDRGVMVRNRASWIVTALHADGAVTARNHDGTIHLPQTYVSTSVELGYAQTVHAAQGATVDRSLLVVDGPIDGRALYVGMTRGRDHNHVYVATDANHTARDTLEPALLADWTDTPATAVRSELHSRLAQRISRAFEQPEPPLTTSERLARLGRHQPPEQDLGLGL